MLVMMISDVNTEVKFLGGTLEVGRSAIAIKSGETQLLVDYGVMLARTPGFPMHIAPKDVDGIVISHAHLDHSGAVPIFYIRNNIPLYGTHPTLDLSSLLISDFIHLSGYYLPFEYLDLQSMQQSRFDIMYRNVVRIKDMELELLNSGHIPGGSQVIVESMGKRILYTSDFNANTTQLLEGADQAFDDLDGLIIEATYANEDHEDRGEVEDYFMEKVNEVVERGGTALVPAFAVGRSQEILCVLAAHDFSYPVSVDGMAKDTNEILMRYPEYIRDMDLFIKALRMTDSISGWRARRRATKKPGVIVSPAGMLKGGNAVFYMNSIARKEENAIFLISYQVPDSPGRRLLDTKKFIIGGRTRNVEAEVEQFDFTSHSGKNQLIETVKKVGSNCKVFVVHGAEGNCNRLAETINDDVGLKAVAPSPGEVFKV